MSWLTHNIGLVIELTGVHLALAVPTIVASLVIAVPIGWAAHRYHRTRSALLTTSGLLYAIPSLPLFIVIPVLIGTNIRAPINVVITLTLYGIALMVRTATDAFDAVPADARRSATALGFSPTARFWRVDLPLAGPVLLSGLRVVVVSTVSLVTVAAVVGSRNLGSLFTDGFQRGIQAEIITGIAMTVLVALLLDLTCVVVGRLLMPWSRLQRRPRTGRPLGDRLFVGRARRGPRSGTVPA